MKKKSNNNQVILFVLLACMLPAFFGCSTRSTTVSTSEVSRTPNNNGYSNYDDRSDVQVVQTKEVTKEDSHHGFFGILGDIIALPFRALAAIF